MPWGVLIQEVLDIIEKETPQNGAVLDLMCGPGYLLGKTYEVRKDLTLHGVDIGEEFIEHAQKEYLNSTFEVADVLTWKSDTQYDLVLCTGGIHHLPYEKQEEFLTKLPSLLKEGGKAILADPYVDDYQNETERKLAAAKLGYEYMVATIVNSATEDVVSATVDILYNDVMKFEYKTSVKKLEPVFNSVFSSVERRKTWPKTESEFGDYYFVCKK